jgi:RecA-family ATPase
MPSDRTESLRIELSRENARRLKAVCAKMRLTASDIFEIGFNATFPKNTPAPAILKKR